MSIPARERLIVALDMPLLSEARQLVEQLDDKVAFYKVGLELVMAGGLEFARDLKRQGKRVFLDMKLLDIGHTVERAVANAAEIDVDFLTIHGSDRKTMQAAVSGRTGSDLKVLAVTVLTNLGQSDLTEQGIAMSPADLVVHRAKLAHACGVDGVIASGQEASRVRAETSRGFLIVTPGIRLPGSSVDDQNRITTPESAIAGGADYIVVGRPITQSDDPRAVADTIVHHIEMGLAQPRTA